MSDRTVRQICIQTHGARMVSSAIQQRACGSKLALPVCMHKLSGSMFAERSAELRLALYARANEPFRPSLLNAGLKTRKAKESWVSQCGLGLEAAHRIGAPGALEFPPTAPTLMAVLMGFAAAGIGTDAASGKWSALNRLGTVCGKPDLACQVSQDFFSAFGFLPFKERRKFPEISRWWLGDAASIPRLANSPQVAALGLSLCPLALVANAFELPVLAAAAMRVDFASAMIVSELQDAIGNATDLELSPTTSAQKSVMEWLCRHQHLFDAEGRLLPDFRAAKKFTLRLQDALTEAGVLPADTDWFFPSMDASQIDQVMAGM